MTWRIGTQRRAHGLRALAGLALLAISSAAMALGLGEIRVKSQPGQPLLAEIPIISNEPGELEQLQARLASPATFERVGLPRPQGLINGLSFAVALDDQGNPVIRVTSAEPVQVAGLNFLIEVDWGQGRLVREYSALVDAPGALASAEQPLIQAPLPAPTNTIVRDAVVTAPLAAAPAPEPTQTSTQAPVPTQAPATVAAAVAPQVPVASAAAEVAVRSGQTLSAIASEVGQGYTLDQTMLALLRSNPDAFIGGNINRLKQGALLRVPQASEMALVGQSEAAALVREQIAQWRQARRPLPQPVDAEAVPNTAKAAAPAIAPRVAEARLEIAAPAAAATARAGIQSGINAEGEGDMLVNQQLTLTKEELAAREAEVQALRTQVAELESLKQQQSKLIALKDSELAAAQQRLAQSQGEAAQPLWLWGGLGLLVAGLVVGWLISRRRAQRPLPVARAPYDSAAMAAAVPATTADEHEVFVPAVADVEADFDRVQVPVVAEQPQATPVPQPTAAAVPAWTAAVARPTWHTGDVAMNVAPLNAAPAGRERLELAIAYLDLGDIETARDLLNEVVAGDDAGARNEAAQLLRELD